MMDDGGWSGCNHDVDVDADAYVVDGAGMELGVPVARDAGASAGAGRSEDEGRVCGRGRPREATWWVLLE